MQSAPFSLEHPSQYFNESRQVRGGLNSIPKPEPGGMELAQTSNGGMELGPEESEAMDITANLSVKDLEEFDNF